MWFLCICAVGLLSLCPFSRSLVGPRTVLLLLRGGAASAPRIKLLKCFSICKQFLLLFFLKQFFPFAGRTDKRKHRPIVVFQWVISVFFSLFPISLCFFCFLWRHMCCNFSCKFLCEGQLLSLFLSLFLCFALSLLLLLFC